LPPPICFLDWPDRRVIWGASSGGNLSFLPICFNFRNWIRIVEAPLISDLSTVKSNGTDNGTSWVPPSCNACLQVTFVKTVRSSLRDLMGITRGSLHSMGPIPPAL